MLLIAGRLAHAGKLSFHGRAKRVGIHGRVVPGPPGFAHYQGLVGEVGAGLAIGGLIGEVFRLCFGGPEAFGQLAELAQVLGIGPLPGGQLAQLLGHGSGHGPVVVRNGTGRYFRELGRGLLPLGFLPGAAGHGGRFVTLLQPIGAAAQQQEQQDQGHARAPARRGSAVPVE